MAATTMAIPPFTCTFCCCFFPNCYLCHKVSPLNGRSMSKELVPALLHSYFINSLTGVYIYCRYKGKEGMAPAAYLQRYQGQGAGMASTGAEIVSTVKDATDLTLSTNTSTKQNSYTNKPLKSPTFARSTTMTSPPPQSNSTTMTSPPPQSNSDSRSLSMTLNISYNESTPITPALTTSLASSKKASAVASLAGVMEGKIASSSSSASQPAPTPSPKPVASPAVAAAAAAEKQKFAPTWHSSAHTPVVDKERKDNQ